MNKSKWQLAPIFHIVPDLKVVVEMIVFGVRGKRSGERAPRTRVGNLIPFPEGEAVSCPISPDMAQEIRGAGITYINETLLEDTTATGQEWPDPATNTRWH